MAVTTRNQGKRIGTPDWKIKTKTTNKSTKVKSKKVTFKRKDSHQQTPDADKVKSGLHILADAAELFDKFGKYFNTGDMGQFTDSYNLNVLCAAAKAVSGNSSSASEEGHEE